MSRYRLWLFRITAIFVIPTLLLILLETGLWIFDFGYPTSFTIESEVDGRIGYVNNDKFIWLFFPPELARPTIPFFISREKPAGTYRIFFLGGSAAQGDPEHTFGVARILQVMLQDQYPEINFEIINAAVTAINSHVVLQIAKDLAHHQPDLFVFYLGNNEVVGPFGAGTVFTPLSPSLSLIRAGILLKTTRLGQALTKIVSAAGKREDIPAEWGGMEMFLAKQVRADDPGLETVYNNFQKNLEDMLQVARKAGVKVIVSTVATNLKDSPPFASLHRSDISKEEKRRWDDIYRSGIQLELESRYSEAIERYLQADAIDDRFADLSYRLARCYWALENYEEARKRYVQARDLDTLRFRADTEINNIIRLVAKARGISLLDTSKFFSANSPHNTPGGEMFYDHVHLNFRGNYILAENLFRQLSPIIAERSGRSKRSHENFSEKECRQRLAFTGYDQYRIVSELFERFSRPPFTNQINHQKLLEQVKEDLAALEIFTQRQGFMEADLQYNWALQQNDSDYWLHYNYAQLLQASGEPEQAAEELRAFIRHLPHYVPVYEQLAKLLINQGKFAEAIVQCEQALQFNPSFSPIYYHLAFALAKQSKFTESIETYRKLTKLNPEGSVDAYNQIGKIQIHLGRLEEAVETFRKAIEFNLQLKSKKDVSDVHFNLAFVLKSLNKNQEAKTELHKAIEGYRSELRKNPNSSETHEVLAKALMESGDYKQATEHFRQTRDLNPTELSNHANLIRILEKQGRFDEAIEASQRAIEFMSKDNQMAAVKTLERYRDNLQVVTSKYKRSERKQ
jgi:tetratricopeptide (TPR) repeat protein